MYNAFLSLLKRDLRLAFRHKSEILNPLFFFVIVVTLFPLGISPDRPILAGADVRISKELEKSLRCRMTASSPDDRVLRSAPRAAERQGTDLRSRVGEGMKRALACSMLQNG